MSLEPVEVGGNCRQFEYVVVRVGERAPTQVQVATCSSSRRYASGVARPRDPP